MYEIRFHGRGGQGAVTASKILASAAFLENKWVTSFPSFGTERRGAPVTAFTRMDNTKIELKSQIYEPDAVIILDRSLLSTVKITEGLKQGGLIVINGRKDVIKESENFRIGYVDATAIALRNGLGDPSNPIVSTALLGAFSKASGVVSLDSVRNATISTVPSRVQENVKAIEDAYDLVELN